MDADWGNFLGLPLGFPVPEDTFICTGFGGFGGALGSLGGRPLGFGEDITELSGRGLFDLGGLPRPRRGGAVGSLFM